MRTPTNSAATSPPIQWPVLYKAPTLVAPPTPAPKKKASQGWVPTPQERFQKYQGTQIRHHITVRSETATPPAPSTTNFSTTVHDTFKQHAQIGRHQTLLIRPQEGKVGTTLIFDRNVRRSENVWQVIQDELGRGYLRAPSNIPDGTEIVSEMPSISWATQIQKVENGLIPMNFNRAYQIDGQTIQIPFPRFTQDGSLPFFSSGDSFPKIQALPNSLKRKDLIDHFMGARMTGHTCIRCLLGSNHRSQTALHIEWIENESCFEIYYGPFDLNLASPNPASQRHEYPFSKAVIVGGDGLTHETLSVKQAGVRKRIYPGDYFQFSGSTTGTVQCFENDYFEMDNPVTETCSWHPKRRAEIQKELARSFLDHHPLAQWILSAFNNPGQYQRVNIENLAIIALEYDENKNRFLIHNLGLSSPRFNPSLFIPSPIIKIRRDGKVHEVKTNDDGFEIRNGDAFGMADGKGKQRIPFINFDLATVLTAYEILEGSTPSDYDIHYQNLSLSPGANEKEIKLAFRTIAKRIHPDHNKGREPSKEELTQFHKAQLAKETLLGLLRKM